MDIQRVRGGLAGRLLDLDIQGYDRAVLNPLPPAYMIYPDPFGPEETYDGANQLRLIILLLASSVDMAGGQDLLDGWVSTEGTSSIKAALDVDTTLGGAVQSALWMGIREYGVMQLSDGGTVFLSAQAMVDVLT